MGYHDMLKSSNIFIVEILFTLRQSKHGNFQQCVPLYRCFSKQQKPLFPGHLPLPDGLTVTPGAPLISPWRFSEEKWVQLELEEICLFRWSPVGGLQLESLKLLNITPSSPGVLIDADAFTVLWFTNPSSKNPSWNVVECRGVSYQPAGKIDGFIWNVTQIWDCSPFLDRPFETKPLHGILYDEAILKLQSLFHTSYN